MSVKTTHMLIQMSLDMCSNKITPIEKMSDYDFVLQVVKCKTSLLHF